MTSSPTLKPTRQPVTPKPSATPTGIPTQPPTSKPTLYPSKAPTHQPSFKPTRQPVTPKPTAAPTHIPTRAPITPIPTAAPSKTPTAAPTERCGNGTCEIDETSTSCSQDCLNIIMTAHNEGNTGAPGVMFDVVATRDIIVKSFDFYTDAKRKEVIEVYTRPGSYSGHELDETGWSLVHSKLVSQMGRNELTQLGDFDTDIIIRAGTTQGFYINSKYFIMYDKGTAEGQILSSDASLAVYEGE